MKKLMGRRDYLRSTFSDSKEDALSAIDKLESAVSNLIMQIEYNENIPEQEYENIEQYISEVNEVIGEIKEHIYFS